MFITTGGNYNGTDYSTMYDRQSKYDCMSPDGTRYLMMGNVDDQDGPTDQYAILIFDVNTDELVYAEPTDEEYNRHEEFEQFQQRVANDTWKRLTV